ncbi:resolvase [Arcobacter acticola]|jgi:DNA invertase Pin-like site-specific DNA recombinase|uniref:Resolvase n=1 Tax=Arcobacter acticola TaxID=1849015 RepID=A0A6M8EN29_9BACT|nr:recombinase family protein [Arcobacter acticola]QKE29968.1 resolvase [Arcobacter acticola]
MSKYLAYIRVSTDKQSLENQKHKILEYAYENKIKIDDFIQIEISSRKNQKDRLLDDVFLRLKDNDTLIVTELSRLGRNMLEILNLIERFNKSNIKLIFVNQPELSTANNALSKLLLSIYGYFAETEREIISERTKQGLAVAKAKGKKLGRQKGQQVTSKYDEFKDKIEELYILGLSVQRIVDYIGIGTQASLSTYIKTRNILRKDKNV